MSFFGKRATHVCSQEFTWAKKKKVKKQKSVCLYRTLKKTFFPNELMYMYTHTLIILLFVNMYRHTGTNALGGYLDSLCGEWRESDAIKTIQTELLCVNDSMCVWLPPAAKYVLQTKSYFCFRFFFLSLISQETH